MSQIVAAQNEKKSNRVAKRASESRRFDFPADSGREDAAGLYWEAVGDGPPVLLIGGIGMDSGSWWRTVPVLARSFRVITFDPRGLGRSAPSPYMCTTDDLAADSIAVMDAAGVDAAHVYGFSLGGMVAQQLALRHPDRVRRLVLGSTHAGGMLYQSGIGGPMGPYPSFVATDPARAAIPYTYGRRCREAHPERIEEDLERRVQHPYLTRIAHIGAVLRHDARTDVRRIEAPTFVVHGAEDRLMPVAAGRHLAETIPGAHLLLFSDAGHFYPTEEPSAQPQIAAFLATG
jgi:3-oxoadipate enol-lactonase